MLDFNRAIHINPFDPQTAGMEEAYLNDLALEQRINKLEYANKELDRLIDVLKQEERKSFDAK